MQDGSEKAITAAPLDGSRTAIAVVGSARLPASAVPAGHAST